MRALYLFMFLTLLSTASQAQIFSCPTCVGSAPTSYTNGQPNDSIFFVCGGNTADLIATSLVSLVGLYNYTWQYFNPFTGTWDFFFTAPLVLSPQSLSGVGPGGYRVVITDAFNTFMGADVAWVSSVAGATSVDVAPIPGGCGGTLNLSALVNPGSATPYYNSPADLSSPVIVGPSTNINICITGNHTFNSDMTFALVGPASCGSPVVVLSPYSSSMGQAVNCNGADNFSNLCFTNQSTNSFNICAAGGNMTGNYGSYGLGAGTPINWSALNGCDATQGLWTLRVQDCYSTDTGTILPTTSLTITGTNGLGAPTTVTFSPAAATPIADGVCAQFGGFNAGCCSTTNIPLNLPAASTVALPMNINYTWTANPAGPVITVASGVVPASGIISATVPAPTQDTQFTLTLSGMQANADCGGSSSDTELYDNQASTPVTVQNPGPLCITAGPVTLTPSITGGTWSGPGVNAATGVFNPTTAGAGTWTINYSTGGACPNTGSTTIQVQAATTSVISAPTTLCSNAAPVALTANNAGGTWTGTGVNASGLFTPTGAVGSQTITYTPAAGQCFSPGTATIQVIQTPTVSVTDVGPVCLNSPPFTLTCSTGSAFWSGLGVSPSGMFNPSIAGPGVVSITCTAGGQCPASDNTPITVVAPVTPVIAAPNQVCVSSSPEILTADLAGGSWSGPGVSPSGNFNPSIAGVGGPYTITYTLNDVCSSSSTAAIMVVAQPVISITDIVDPLCANGIPVTLSASLPGGSWSGIGVNTVTGVFTPSSGVNGPNNIIYSIGGLCPATDNTVINVVAAPAVTITQASPFCLNSLNTTLTANQTGGTWSGTGILDPLTGSFSPSIAGVGPTAITYTFTSAPCTVTATSNVIVNPLPTVFAGIDAIICSGASTALQATGASTYQWSINGGAAVGLNNPNIANPSASPTTTTTYSVLGIDVNGCTNVDQVQVSVNASPTVNAGANASICPGIPTTLGATGASTYAWSPSTGLTGGNTATPSANPASTQTYTVTGTDANGCQNTDQVTVTVFPQPNVIAGATSPIIECQTAQLTAGGLVSYNWMNTTGPDATIASPNTAITDVTPLTNATYTVTGLDANGCAGSATISVAVNPITVSIVNATSVNPSTFSFDITSNATNFDWDFYTDGTTDANTSATTIQNSYSTGPTPPLDYIITTVTASIGNCEAQDTIHVFIDNTLLEWPNIVIADGDGINDVLSFLSQDPALQPNWQSITTVPTVTDFKVEIFNRWGKKVGEVNAPTGSWDPKEFGAGVYFYVVSYSKRSTGMNAEEVKVERALQVFVK
ncbi:MAG: hypothetical protein RLZZ91_247 [Bacteroidota bacterium]|jgi:hypothetical protein